jgi:hypothetical protein
VTARRIHDRNAAEATIDSASSADDPKKRQPRRKGGFAVTKNAAPIAATPAALA